MSHRIGIHAVVLARLVVAFSVSIAAAAVPALAQPSLPQLRIIAPAAPGGGWDQTARVMQQVLQRTGIVGIAPVENVPGAAGTIGLARFIGAERGSSDTVMVSGLIMLGGIVTHDSPVTLADVIPIARLTGEYEVIAVPTASPFKTILLEEISQWPNQPGTISAPSTTWSREDCTRSSSAARDSPSAR